MLALRLEKTASPPPVTSCREAKEPSAAPGSHQGTIPLLVQYNLGRGEDQSLDLHALTSAAQIFEQDDLSLSSRPQIHGGPLA